MPEIGEKVPGVVIRGDCLDVLPTLPDARADAIVTDPPYGLEFMGKEWDTFGGKTPTNGFRRAKNLADVGRDNVFGRASGRGPEFKAGAPFQKWCESWAVEALRVLKPGGYALIFGGTRTYHRLACAVEDAGFEIRDCLMFMYGTGMPKGQGCLKPAYEPILLARKPAKRVLPLGIDDCRIPTEEDTSRPGSMGIGSYSRMKVEQGCRPRSSDWNGVPEQERATAGRWPANVCHDGSDEVLEAFAAFGEKGGGFGVRGGTPDGHGKYGSGFPRGGMEEVGYGDSGTAARFFYCGKAAKKERYVMLKCDCETRIIPECERKQGRSRRDRTDTTSPPKDTSGGGSTAGRGSSTSSCGSVPTESSRRDGRSTTSTATSKTTDSKTFGSSARPNTSESTADASCEAASGGSLARSVASTSQSTPNTGTRRRKDILSTEDASRATSAASSRRNVCEKCGAAVIETSHPTVKPLKLMRWLVRLVCPPGGVVLDPFAGSGTTALACRAESRGFVLIEKEAQYVEIIRRRLKNQTQV